MPGLTNQIDGGRTDGRISRQGEIMKKMTTKCTYDPRELAGAPIGMFHCPECGEMVLAGVTHPNYSLLEIQPDDLIHNNGLPADDQEREDADRLVRVAASHGFSWPSYEAFRKWEEVSADCGAGWMMMPESDEDLWRWITYVETRKGVI